MKRKKWERDGVTITFSEYRLEDFYNDSDLEKIPREAALKAFPDNVLPRNLKRRRRRLANYILQEFLNIIVDRVLERDEFVHGETRILVREIQKDPNRMVKKSKRRNPLFHTRGKWYGVVLEMGWPHKYYVRLKGWVRYQLYQNIKEKGYNYKNITR